MKKGDTVKTEHGTGVIIGKDMPESRAWRWIVKITEPGEYKDRELCYFAREVVK